MLDTAPRKIVLIGASRGLGRSLAVALAARGDHVIGTGRDLEELERTAAACRELPGIFEAHELEVRNTAAVDAFIGSAGEIDMCIVNAGIANHMPFVETTADDVRHMLEVNTVGAFSVMRAAAATMITAGHGRIVPIASVYSLEGAAQMAAYVASKHALLGFARTLAMEVEGTGVFVTTICPGWIRTAIEGESSLSGGMDPDDAAAAIVGALGVGPSIGTCEFLFQAEVMI